MSNDMIMNGPCDFEMKVWVINDETGQEGQVTVGLGAFQYPTPHMVKERLDKLVAEDFEGALEGFRLMTKREALEAMAVERTGGRFAIAMGSKEWDPI